MRLCASLLACLVLALLAHAQPNPALSVNGLSSVPRPNDPALSVNGLSFVPAARPSRSRYPGGSRTSPSLPPRQARAGVGASQTKAKSQAASSPRSPCSSRCSSPPPSSFADAPRTQARTGGTASSLPTSNANANTAAAKFAPTTIGKGGPGAMGQPLVGYDYWQDIKAPVASPVQPLFVREPRIRFDEQAEGHMRQGSSGST
ncbi:hypothetical protein B0H13DRAFT_2328885 [Mycena leptocephala]|nr:hypothetical protein B0H13DRAFT_2328885 [Mycena leptocephala]